MAGFLGLPTMGWEVPGDWGVEPVKARVWGQEDVGQNAIECF